MFKLHKINRLSNLYFAVLLLIGGLATIILDIDVSGRLVGIMMIMYAFDSYLLYSSRNEYYELMNKYNEKDKELQDYALEEERIKAYKELEDSKNELESIKMINELLEKGKL